MATNFSPIYSTTPRHAENSDARLDIRRHDPDQERRRKDDDEKAPGPVFDTYDNAIVSIESLRVFLLNFMRTLIDTAERDSESAVIDSATAQISEPPQTTQAANPYTSAYTNTYKQTVRSTQPAATPVKKALLENEEIREIHTLLADIEVLIVRGIQDIRLEQDETFLKSLSNAVKKALGS